MRKDHILNRSRRDFVKLGSAAALSRLTGPFFTFPERLVASQKTLKVMQWNHFVPRHDVWFNEFARDWGNQHDTNVVVDNVNSADLRARAAAEASAQKGHDLLMFLSPPAAYESQVIPLNDVCEEAAKTYGKLADVAYKSTYNPISKRFFAFPSFYSPTPGIRIKELWDEAGYSRGITDYGALIDGATKIKNESGVACGIELTTNAFANASLFTVLSAFGGSIQDEAGSVTINSKGTIEAVKYMAALYRSAEQPEVLTWSDRAKITALREGSVSYATHSPAVVVEDDDDDPRVPRKPKCPKPPCAERTKILSSPLKGQVPGVALASAVGSYVIWKFSENHESAKQFLLDLVANSKNALVASKLYNFPAYPGTVPQLQELLANASKTAPGKYSVLADADRWTINFGYPGYASAFLDLVFWSWVIPTMFAKVARGTETAEDAVKTAEKETKRARESFT